MPFLSLLLRLSLIAALCLNGYASAAMIAGGGHAMSPRAASAPTGAIGAAMDEATGVAMADCHQGMDRPAMAQHDTAPAAAPHTPERPAVPHEGDCCGKFACQCDCLQAASIAPAIAPLPPRLDSVAPARANAHAPPDGVLSLPIRPPIA